MHGHHGHWPYSLGVWLHFSEAVYIGWQVYCSGGQKEMRDRELLLGLIGEQME
jgi:hypothetical protein